MFLGNFAVHKHSQTSQNPAGVPAWAPLSASRSWRFGQRGGAQLKFGQDELLGLNDEITERPHIPVMLPEVLRAVDLCHGDTIIDATFGAGGYTRAFLECQANVIAIDRDPNAIAAGQALVDAADGKLKLVQGRFSNLDALAKRP